MTGRKKGMSIGAAMKQRMDSQPPEEPTADDPQAAAELPGRRVSPPVSTQEPEPLESFNTRLPKGLLRRLKVHSALEGGKIQDVVARALEEYLAGHAEKER